MNNYRTWGLITLVGLFTLAGAQSDTKEMRTLKLQLKSAQLELTESESAFKKAEAEYKEAQALFEKGLYTKLELAQSEKHYQTAFLDRQGAVIDLEKTRLNFLNDALYITLEKAALYRDREGYKHALVTLKNNSNVKKIVDDDGAYSDADKQGLLSIDNLTVRVLKDEKLIGRPFEYKVPVLGYRQSKTLDFTLQKETEEVTVQLSYGDTIIELPVYLEKEAKENDVLIEAGQFSQEGELGTRINYDLSLERFVDDDGTFSLELVGMPEEYTYEFYEVGGEKEASGDRRVSRIRFKQGVTTKSIVLTINLPKEIPNERINEKVTFYVLGLDRFGLQRLADLKMKSEGKRLEQEQLDSAHLSYETLEMVPRGRAEVEITAANLFVKSKIGEPIKSVFILHNSGTVSLDKIRVSIVLPLDWSATVVPEKDIVLDVEGKQQVKLEIMPAPDVVAGDYQIKLEAKTLHEGREIEAIPREMRIQIEGKSNFVIGAILMILLVGLIVGVAIMTIRISRR